MTLRELEAKWREGAEVAKAFADANNRHVRAGDAFAMRQGTFNECADELASTLAQAATDEALPWKLEWHADGAGGGHYKIINAKGVIVEPSRIVKFANRWAASRPLEETK